ncbi:hypothetical protein GQX74_007761 [Glossina fuscipes]|nr:hypothetical protein GQX74_007761 [Glossina fuscipes]
MKEKVYSLERMEVKANGDDTQSSVTIEVVCYVFHRCDVDDAFAFSSLIFAQSKSVGCCPTKRSFKSTVDVDGSDLKNISIKGLDELFNRALQTFQVKIVLNI